MKRENELQILGPAVEGNEFDERQQVAQAIRSLLHGIIEANGDLQREAIDFQQDVEGATIHLSTSEGLQTLEDRFYEFSLWLHEHRDAVDLFMEEMDQLSEKEVYLLKTVEQDFLRGYYYGKPGEALKEFQRKMTDLRDTSKGIIEIRDFRKRAGSGAASRSIDGLGRRYPEDHKAAKKAWNKVLSERHRAQQSEDRVMPLPLIARYRSSEERALDEEFL